MGKHRTDIVSRAGLRGSSANLTVTPAPSTFFSNRYGFSPRFRLTRTIFAFLASTAFILVPMVDPTAAFAMKTTYAPDAEFYQPVLASQTVTVDDSYETEDSDRGTFKITVKKPKPVEKPAEESSSAAPAAGNPDPGSAKALAKSMLADRGWGSDQYNCLVSLWNKESGWNVYAHNVASGAYGIAQALPGSKMASVGSDWKTSAKTQITWGLGYIEGRYGSPCGAWASSESRGWY